MRCDLLAAATACAAVLAIGFTAQAQDRQTVSPGAYGSGTSTTSIYCDQQPPDIGKSSGCRWNDPRKPPPRKDDEPDKPPHH